MNDICSVYNPNHSNEFVVFAVLFSNSYRCSDFSCVIYLYFRSRKSYVLLALVPVSLETLEVLLKIVDSPNRLANLL